MKVRQQPGGYAQNISAQLDVLSENCFFFVAAQNLFQDSNFPKSYFLPIRGYSWNKNKTKTYKDWFIQI